MSDYVENDIADYLESVLSWLRRSSTVANPGEQNFFIGDMPTDPLEAVSMYEYQGDMPLYTFGASRVERPRLQITTRAERYDRAREMAMEIYNSVADAGPLSLSGTDYLKVRAMSRPTEMSPDGENNSQFTFGLMIWRQV